MSTFLLVSLFLISCTCMSLLILFYLIKTDAEHELYFREDCEIYIESHNIGKIIFSYTPTGVTYMIIYRVNILGCIQFEGNAVRCLTN